MRISATDIDDGNNSIVLYDLEPRVKMDDKYFHIDRNTGVIFLDKPIDVRKFIIIMIVFSNFNCSRTMIIWENSINILPQKPRNLGCTYAYPESSIKFFLRLNKIIKCHCLCTGFIINMLMKSSV